MTNTLTDPWLSGADIAVPESVGVDQALQRPAWVGRVRSVFRTYGLRGSGGRASHAKLYPIVRRCPSGGDGTGRTHVVGLRRGWGARSGPGAAESRGLVVSLDWRVHPGATRVHRILFAKLFRRP